ncbi:DUF1768 domain-containing protein [Flavobacterium album]|uniref:DUF1768 domain-containing protein n=1 Tax=Flavobacterium album TaxID=2175091 RepID=A0A2S1QWP4_9FLAO|nr:NADAR family protein [Flavobacterium album]AWH84803.1 DUF1768 domain-containing protein [Flavobacterium album]
MRYSKEKLIADKGPKEYLFFWGHQPSKDGSITKSCFSQWWESAFTVDGTEYKSAEHWMMAKKAALFGDSEMEARILECITPVEAKKLGREVRGYDDALWTANRYNIVMQGNYHKFSQNEALKNFLLSTGDHILVEASPVDPIWGIGLEENSADAFQPENWRGLNLLGFAIMEAREHITNNETL